MPVERINKAIDKLYEAGVFGVILTGGEPLLVKNFEEVVDHMAGYGDSIEFSINTNGVPLSENLISQLATKMGKTFRLNFGMEGCDAKTYGISRGEPGAWNAIVKNVNLANEYELSPSFMYCLTRKSLPFVLPSLKYYTEELGMKQGALLCFMPIGRGRENLSELQIPLVEWEGFFRTVDSFRDSAPWLAKAVVWGIYARWRVYLAYMRKGADLAKLKDDVATKWGYFPISEAYGGYFGTACCHAGTTDLVIDPDGNVRPCFMMTNSSFVIGNVFTDSLEELWVRAPRLKELRGLDLNKIGEPCKSCEINTLCCATCRACAYEFTGDLYAADPNCPLVSGELISEK
jgi:radical SAM protein with 4Fe4S-binding SPASM domain